MRLFYGVLLFAALATAALAYAGHVGPATAEPILAVASPSDALQQAPESPNQPVNDDYAKRILGRIAGREKEAAGRVFKNIRLAWFKSVPAEDFIGIMNEGYSRALGVACTHCHDDQDFASDAKRPKRAAREMAVMHWNINQQLGKMRNLAGAREVRFVNCAVCHRGRVDPRGAGG